LNGLAVLHKPPPPNPEVTMRTYSPLFLLIALGVMSTAASAQADTRDWTCKSCPYPKGATAVVELGVGYVSGGDVRFGDYTGLDKKGAFALVGGELNYRGDTGYYASLLANDLGLDSRSLSAQSGRDGIYGLRLGYSEIPRHFGDDGMSPFIGIGSSVLTLPAGFPSSGTATMPLASTLRPVDLGLSAKRFELGASLVGGENWTYRLQVRHDTRDGTRPSSASFYATAAQFALPVDQVTDQFEVSVAYASRALQLNLGYQASRFSNGLESLTWTSPFWTVTPGATRGQLALAPDNQFHQVTGSAGYQVLPNVRASADFAIGRMTQDAAYLASTLNPVLAASLPALGRSSLDGRVDTFNGSVKLSATPTDKLRVNAIYARDVRDNRTAVGTYPAVSTDIFVWPGTRTNQPYSFWQDRFKLNADFRASDTMRLAAGAEQDNRKRSYQEVVDTRETTLWGRFGLQPREGLNLALKVAHADRRNSGDGTSIWLDNPENPALRKYNLASRQRDSANLRADFTLNEKISFGVSAEYAADDYSASAVGLNSARNLNLTADMAWAFSERTRMSVFVTGERIRSLQSGSQSFAAADWSANSTDRFEILGLSVKHAAIVDKLDIGADLTVSRSHSDVVLTTVIPEPTLPTQKTAVDSLKLYATYKLKDNISLTGSWWHERYDAQDWQVDGLMPATVVNLLALGQPAPNYRVNVVRLALRYRF